MPFLQIHNNDNGSVVVLALPRPSRRRRCFAAATLIAIVLNGSRLAINCARMGGEGAGWVYTPFPQRQTRSAQTIAVLAPSRPWRRGGHLAAALRITICHNRSRPIVNGERIGGGRPGLVSRYNNQPVERTQTIYVPSGLTIRQGGRRRMRRKSQTSCYRPLALQLWHFFGSNATINLLGQRDMNNLCAWARMRMRMIKRRYTSLLIL